MEPPCGWGDAWWDQRSEGLFAYVSCERRVPSDHPLQCILPLVDSSLGDLSPQFAQL